MQSNKNRLFTIGQFAAIHGVTKKTLMWYDEIGLLKPATIGENGYRYYTYQQSSILETILILRELNLSIKEIQSFLANRSASNMEQLLRQKMDELESHISYLQNMKTILTSRHQDMMTLLHIDLSEISVIEKEETCLAVVPIMGEQATEADVEQIIAEAKKHQLRCLHDATYGSMIAVENLYKGNFDDYSALYIELPYSTLKAELHMQPAGKYLRAFCKGSWDNLPKRYEEILSFAKSKGMLLYGHSYETGINETVIDNFDDYITQIEIPIKPN